MDVNEELRGSGGGSGWWGGQGGWDAMLGVGGDVGYGRIEGIVQCTKRYCTIIRK